MNDVTNSTTSHQDQSFSRRAFLGLLSAFAASSRSSGGAIAPPLIPATAINHVTINVSDLERSLEWYQGLFGLPIVARQGNTVILRVGEGPQFIAIDSDARTESGIRHLGLSTDGFDAGRIVEVLAEHGVTLAESIGVMQAHLRKRGPASGGAPEGTPELFIGDPDGLIIQLQDTTYCGGSGVLGNEPLRTPEPAPTEGLLAVRDFNHFTMFVSDQERSVEFYQNLFRLPIDTWQGSLPILRVGTGNQFLALAGGSPRSDPTIHHVCLTVEEFDPNHILGVLEDYGVTPRRDDRGPAGPLKSYVTMRMPDRGGAPEGTPELYFTDPDGILLQVQDMRYCGGSGYLGDERGVPDQAGQILE